MSKLFLLLFVVLLAGCIEIIDDVMETEEPEEEKNALTNVTFDIDLEEEKENETVTVNSSYPDLEITNVYWRTLYPDFDETDELKIRAVNNGNISIDGFEYKVTLFKDYDKFKEETFDYNETVNASQEIRIEHEYSFNQTGSFKAEVYLDWDNSIKEADEMNNYEQTSAITVSEPNHNNETGSNESVLGDKKCVDSDEGLDYYRKGRCVDDGPFILGMNDYCRDNFHLIELYCSNSTMRCKFDEPYECYCKNGACV